MNLSSFIWSVADLLRGKYKPHEYGQLAEIDADPKVVTDRILTMIAGLSA